jgi:uncharacterized protein YbbC (DUF1343 family)
VKCGLDVFLEKRGGPWRGRRLGLIAHQASVTADLEPAVQALLRVKGPRLTALFGPEHGLTGAAQDQVEVAPSRDEHTGLPVFSLYGDRREPTAEMLKDVDALMFDLQDIGVRYYTFIWTMALAMKACAKAGKSFVVLDRPNPLGGETREGNILDPFYSSFVGLYPLPVRHGMTCGELALYFNHKFKLGADLHVIKMRGWRRKQWFDQTGAPWVLPSPNMPTLDTAAVYAGMCLLEATNLSEGRGTTRPFEIVGAPFMDSQILAQTLTRKKIPGAVFRPCAFLPTFNKWAGQPCQGIQIHVTDRRRFPSFLTGLLLLQAVRRLWPRNFEWKTPPYEYETQKPPIDILCGTAAVRQAIESDTDVETLARTWPPALRAFQKEIAPFLLYRL